MNARDTDSGQTGIFTPAPRAAGARTFCLTYLTDKLLRLHVFNDQLKEALKENADNIIRRKQLLSAKAATDDPGQIKEIMTLIAELVEKHMT